MENFRRQFTREAVETLESLSNDLRAAEKISDSWRHAAFRTLHTIKGTAQTFGYPLSSLLAHELEGLLSAINVKETSGSIDSKTVFLEGIELLIASLTQKDFDIPTSFTEKLRRIVPDAATVKNISDNVSPGIADEFFSQLSNQEKTTLRSALENGKNLFCLEIGFELANFADGLINFRQRLTESGEIIATLPSEKFGGDGQIGFQILLASATEISRIELIAEGSAAKIIFDSSANVFSNDAAGGLAQIVEHGKHTAKTLGKQIRFETFADKTFLPPEQLKIIFDVLLHLVRNAVDHAIDAVGKIEIHLKVEDNQSILIVDDDGSGINFDEIKTKAIERNLISAERLLTEQETIDLIFLPEFSTKPVVTELSGRGVGLDAVKSAVEKSGGKINVRTERGKGTTFEIFLPR